MMAMAVALLVGAVVGRTMPAFLLAAVVMVAWSVVAVPATQSILSRQFAVWVPDQNDDWRDGVGQLTYVDYGLFDTSTPGVPGEPGARFTYDDLEREAREACGAPPDDDTGESPEWTTWGECADPIYQRGNTGEMSLQVSRSHYGEYAWTDTLLSLLVGGAALLLTFPVVARRRPG